MSTTFENDRLDLFRRHGFGGDSQWLDDREGRKTYAIVRGEGVCPTILVHGGIAEASVWSLAAGSLSGYVVVPDRPGCGLSYPVDYRGVDYRGAASDWLLDLVDALDVETANVVGNSMGGFFAMAFATAHPERVRRLVLVGAPAGLDRELPLFLRLWGNPIVGRLIGKMKISDVEKLRKLVFASLVAHPERLPRDLLEVALAAAALPGTGLTSRTMLQAVSTLSGWRDELLMREDMAKADVPTAFVWGEKDSFASPASGHDLAARMADARVEVVPDAGHLPQLDEPNTIAALISDFLDQPGNR